MTVFVILFCDYNSNHGYKISNHGYNAYNNNKTTNSTEPSMYQLKIKNGKPLSC